MEFGFLIMRFLASTLKWISFPFITFSNRKNAETPIPTIDKPLLLCSATKLAEMIRNREVKSETVINTYIERIKIINCIINAVVEDRFVEAIAEAQEVDRFLAETDLTSDELAMTKPLLGVPLTVKESCSVKGLSLAVGFTFMKGRKAEEDGVAVSKLKAAGAIPLLVSNTSELCLSIECNNLINGKTRNPYNTSYTSGGSSGGEGALISSASSVIGIGSDLAGSLRIPAMFNGIFAHKPTSRLVSCQGHWPTSTDEFFLDYAIIGPLARYAEDLKLMMKVLSSNDKIRFNNKVELNNINLFCMKDIGFYVGTHSVQLEIKAALQNATQYLSKTYNMTVNSEQFVELQTLADSSLTVLMDLDDKIKVLQDPNNPKVKYSMIGQLWKYAFSKPEVMPHNAVGDTFVRKANCFIPKTHVKRHHNRIKALRQKILDVLGNNGILLFPTYPTSAFRDNEIMWHMLNCAMFTLPFNILGFPSTQVPLGFNAKGMPIGIQIISAPYQDELCLAVAEVLEKYFGGWKPPFKI